ncbi:DUF6093 family protein [Brevibacterium sp. BDJS002]|uniref:DUF6093 family protein n=1 Tax=Brevibacterium sp. BDJS002 TaxID=3020906 RepID=UPI002307CD0C|nr:DUF6093 family protein [Brevibacterium sp. BDJS002]WCE39124.1 DUF6093 family protein [Brevibacterium sp. BDJS002]
MSPLPARGRLRVIPDGWSEHHRPAAYGFLTGDCTAYTVGAPGDWTPGGGGNPTYASKWEHAPCSAQFLTQSSRPVTVADGVEIIASHRISVPIASTWLHYGDTIQILDNPDDPALNGREFQVLVAESGTTNWTRDYLCQDINGREAKAA